MSNFTAAQVIVNITVQYTIYGYSIILLLGIFGNTMNITIFQGLKVFKRNQCTFYILIESIANFAVLIIALPFRVAEYAFSFDLTQRSVVWCKIRPMISQSLALIAFSAVCFAAFDQYLATNHHGWIRKFSNIQLARRSMIISTLIWSIYNCIFLYFFDLKDNVGCVISNNDFARYYSFGHFIVLNGLFPLSVAGSFSVLAYWNVRRIVQLRIAVTRRKLDKQLTAMILAKVIFFVGSILPAILFRIYILNVTVDRNDSLRISVHNLISSFAYSLFYMNSSVSVELKKFSLKTSFRFQCTFYVFLLVSSRFRRQVKASILAMFSHLQVFCLSTRHNQIRPNLSERSEFDGST